jgi:TolB-like protein
MFPDPEKTRIAILPFKNISQSSSDDYLADGMTEEIISALKFSGAPGYCSLVG